MRAALLAATLLALPAAAHAQEPCAKDGARPLALDTDASIDNRVRYEVTGTPFALCVERAALPYSAQHGHTSMIVVRVYFGRHESRFVMGPGEYVDWKGFRLDAHIDRPSYTQDNGVSVRVHREP